MSSWFPHVDDEEGIQKALKGGVVGALAFAAMTVLGFVFVLFGARLPGADHGPSVSGLVGMLVELAIPLIAAWRFRNGKGLIWGAVTLVAFLGELAVKVANGTAGIFWLFFYAAVAAGLVNGIRGAWARRTFSPEDDLAEVFE